MTLSVKVRILTVRVKQPPQPRDRALVTCGGAPDPLSDAWEPCDWQYHPAGDETEDDLRDLARGHVRDTCGGHVVSVLTVDGRRLLVLTSDKVTRQEGAA